MTDPTPRIVFYSSKSENTLRAVNRINLPSVRLPMSKAGPFPVLTDEYVLIIPTFGGGKTMGAVPQPVRSFLNQAGESRKLCRGVIGGGNTTFQLFATAANLVADKLEVPVLYKFEVLGMPHEIDDMREILFSLFPDLEQYRDEASNTFSHPSMFR